MNEPPAGCLAFERTDGDWSWVRLDEGDPAMEWARALYTQLGEGKAKLLVMDGPDMRMGEVDEAILGNEEAA